MKFRKRETKVWLIKLLFKNFNRFLKKKLE